MTRFFIRCGVVPVLIGVAAAAHAEPEPMNSASLDPPILADMPAPEQTPSQPSSPPGEKRFKVDPDAYSIISAVKGLSTHKPMYVLPVSYSPDIVNGNNTEVMFQISAKEKVFGSDFYFGYTQKSFWQLYNRAESSPFRETDYNPEVFYRYLPDDWKLFDYWGADLGFEHESNGRAQPESRSWNRVYLAPFQAKGKHLAYLKFWYRIPEAHKTSPLDPHGDDNPDIQRYYGYSELQYSQQLGAKQLLSAMVRGNVKTGKGAVSLNWSIPSPEGYVFYGVFLWRGYGESLIDYNRLTTRAGVGIMFSR